MYVCMYVCRLRLIFRRIQLWSRRTIPAKDAIFPCFTVCIFARNLARVGLRWVGSTNRKIPFHSSYGLPEISNQNFWSNGKRPYISKSPIKSFLVGCSLNYACVGQEKYSLLISGILYSPQFRSHGETKMAARRTQRSASTISRKNRGL